MTQLLDLPLEILTLIVEDFGGRNLRRSVSNLTICSKWYNAARAVYLSGLEVSKFRINGCDVGKEAGEWKCSSQRPMMYKNTREFRIRLLGHWWDQNTKSTLEVSDSLQDYEAEPNEPPAEFTSIEGRKAVMRWQKNVLNPVMKVLFQDLGNFEVLERASLETVFDASEEIGPQWEYLNSSTIATFLRNLPLIQDLRHLTLDLCSGLNYDETNDAHVCEEVARILHRFQSVRLRLKLICSSVFHLPNYVAASDIRLKSLVVKLHLPMFQYAIHLTSRSCTTMQGSHNPIFLHEYIIKSAQQYLLSLSAIRSHGRYSNLRTSPQPQEDMQSHHGMDLFRISCVAPSYPSVYTVDCLTMRQLYIGPEFFAYEDDGWPYWFEDDPEAANPLLDGGPFIFSHRVS